MAALWRHDSMREEHAVINCCRILGHIQLFYPVINGPKMSPVGIKNNNKEKVLPSKLYLDELLIYHVLLNVGINKRINFLFVCFQAELLLTQCAIKANTLHDKSTC